MQKILQGEFRCRVDYDQISGVADEQLPGKATGAPALKANAPGSKGCGFIG